MLRICTAAAVIAILSGPEYCRAQQAAGPVRLSGSIGVTAKGYMAEGIADRQAPTVLEANANTRFSVFGLSSGFRLTYSTDQSGLRQSVNRLAFQTEWSTGRVAAGDVSPEYSPYSVRGSTVRGGLVEWQPFGLFFGVAGGRSRRGVNVPAALDRRGSVFSRWIGTARAGVGSPDKTHFHVITVYSEDAASSLEDPGELRPNSNLSVTPDFAVSLLSQKILVRGSATLSSVSIDSRTSSPTFETLFISKNPEIRSTYASEFAARFNGGAFGMDALFTRIMPGFESHGLTQIRSDEQTVRLAPRFTVGQGRVSFAASAARTNTNLQNDQLTTTYRDMATLTAAVRVSPRVNVSANYAGMRNKVDPSEGAPIAFAQQLQVGHNVVVVPVFIIGSSAGVMQTVSLNAGWQTFRDESDEVKAGIRDGFESTNRSLMVTHSARLTRSLTTTLSGGRVRSDANTTELRITTADAGVSIRFAGGLTTTASVGWAQNEAESVVSAMPFTSTTRRLSAALGASYAVSRNGSLRMDLRAARNDLGDDIPSFSESRATIGYTHRF